MMIVLSFGGGVPVDRF